MDQFLAWWNFLEALGKVDSDNFSQLEKIRVNVSSLITSVLENTESKTGVQKLQRGRTTKELRIFYRPQNGFFVNPRITLLFLASAHICFAWEWSKSLPNV